MKKYEIYLPLKYNDGKEIEAEKIKLIREELIAAFGALTVSSQSAPYQGRWKYGGVDFIDDIIKIFPAVTESGERLVPLCRCAMKQADVVHRVTAAGLVIDATIVPHHEIAQGPYVTVRVPGRRLVSE
jgi:hypothetical protein